MAVISQAVKILDVPTARSQTIMGNVNRMQVYRLAGIEPAPIVKILEDGGGLEPTTRLQIDEKNKAIVAYASLADHMAIRAVIGKLDGSGRKFEVIPLRRLPADYVAGTIEFMMAGGGGEEKQQNRRGYFEYFDPWGGGGRRNQDEQRTDKFRVDADTENNRLLLWANEIELEEVVNLMAKLGEIPDRNGGSSTVRSMDLDPDEDTAELLERLQRAWKTIAPNHLDIPGVIPPSRRKSSTPDTLDDEAPPGSTSPHRPRATSLPSPSASPRPANATDAIRDEHQFEFVAEPRVGSEDPVDTADDPREPAPQDRVALQHQPTLQPPPQLAEESIGDPSSPPQREPAAIRISVTPDGRLVFASTDTQALDMLEELAARLAPPKRDYQVFRLKYAPAYWVKQSLKEYFEEKKDENSRNRGYFFYDFPPPQQNKESRSRLSRRKPLKFISDSDTNTILVQGADANQLRTIRELVELYDQPEPTNAKSMRITTLYQVRWSKASTLSDAVKEVYRDLLSSNDKALQSPAEKNQRPQTQNTYIFGEEGSGDRDKKTPVSFKGKLSLGVDDVSNTILISADGETLTQNIVKMLKTLDEASKPSTTVQVLQLKNGVSAKKVGTALKDILGDKAPSGQQADDQGAKREGGQPPQGEGQRGQGRPRERGPE